MDLKTDSYSNCLLYLKENHGYSVGDLSNLLGIPQEIINFFINPERNKTLRLLNAILEKEGYL
ncbi:hypothetical protein [Legionella sp. W05-934-2]|uniref:hypothetical protein n=1 Tax=Legionella sp. W05-934-2 TaxID=1198649 RepID=UPI003461ED6A